MSEVVFTVTASHDKANVAISYESIPHFFAVSGNRDTIQIPVSSIQREETEGDTSEIRGWLTVKIPSHRRCPSVDPQSYSSWQMMIQSGLQYPSQTQLPLHS